MLARAGVEGGTRRVRHAVDSREGRGPALAPLLRPRPSPRQQVTDTAQVSAAPRGAIRIVVVVAVRENRHAALTIGLFEKKQSLFLRLQLRCQRRGGRSSSGLARLALRPHRRREALLPVALLRSEGLEHLLDAVLLLHLPPPPHRHLVISRKTAELRRHAAEVLPHEALEAGLVGRRFDDCGHFVVLAERLVREFVEEEVGNLLDLRLALFGPAVGVEIVDDAQVEQAIRGEVVDKLHG